MSARFRNRCTIFRCRPVSGADRMTRDPMHRPPVASIHKQWPANVRGILGTKPERGMKRIYRRWQRARTILQTSSRSGPIINYAAVESDPLNRKDKTAVSHPRGSLSVWPQFHISVPLIAIICYGWHVISHFSHWHRLKPPPEDRLVNPRQ